MDEIKEWLNSSQNYLNGVEIYAIHGDNEFLKRRFRAGPDIYNKQKLTEELQRLSDHPEPVKEKGIEPQKILINNHQAQYASLEKKRNEVVRQIERNMALLDISRNKHVLHETAKQILLLHQLKTETWAQIDYYQENGCFEAISEKEEKSKKKEIQLLYQAISKANKRLENTGCKNPAKTEQLKAKHLNRLAELKNQI